MRQCPDCYGIGGHSDGCPNDPGDDEFEEELDEEPFHDDQEEQEHNLVSIQGILMMRGEP